MSLDQALTDAMKTIPDCVAAGYVDMSSGMLLGVSTLDSHPQEVLDLVAAATADLFQGPTVTQIEDAFNKSRGDKKGDQSYFQELLVFSENLIHVFLRTQQYPDHVVAFITRKSANIGMVLVKSRMAVAGITDAV